MCRLAPPFPHRYKHINSPDMPINRSMQNPAQHQLTFLRSALRLGVLFHAHPPRWRKWLCCQHTVLTVRALKLQRVGLYMGFQSLNKHFSRKTSIPAPSHKQIPLPCREKEPLFKSLGVGEGKRKLKRETLNYPISLLKTAKCSPSPKSLHNRPAYLEVTILVKIKSRAVLSEIISSSRGEKTTYKLQK